jgi:hypothetical protein
MFTAALVGATLLGALPVHVEASGCPSSAEIEGRLGAMLRTTSPGSTDVARVTRSGAGLQIELVSPDGAVIAERGLDYAGTCTELADMVAVIVASWESDVHPEFARPAADLVSATLPAKVESSTATRVHLDLAAGVGASLADSVAFGGAAALTWFPTGGALGVRLSGLGETTHTTDVGIRQAHWNRWLVALEVDWRLAGVTTSLDFHGGAALAILRAGGVNFDQNDSATSLSAAALAGARWSFWISRHWAAYADITAAYFQRDQALRGTEPQQLPHFQGLLTLGVAVGESSSPR